MKIGLVDQTGWQGGRLYMEHLARCLLRLPEGERPEVIWFGPRRDLHPELSNLDRHVLDATRFRATERIELLARVAHLGWQLRLDFVYPFPGRLAPHGGSAYWIPDFQHRRLPELFSALHRLKRDVAYYVFALTSPILVISSEAVRADLHQWQPELVKKSRILRFSTPFSATDVDLDSPAAARVLSGLPRPYAYIPNQMWRHKDHPTVLRAAAQLRAKHSVTIPLVFSGERYDHRHPAWSHHIDDLITELGLKDQTHFLGFLPRSIQLAVLRQAHLVVQPSLFEGWSTVVEDTRALGQRILLSDIPPNLEQEPPNSTYFRAGDPDSLAGGLRHLWPIAPPAPSLHELEPISHGRSLDVARTFLQIASEARRQ